MATRQEVYNAIDSERDYQEVKIKENRWNDPKRVGEFLSVLRVLLADAEKKWYGESDLQPTETLSQIRKIAAVSVACMEQNGVVSRSSCCGHGCGCHTNLIEATAESITQSVH